MSRFLSTMAAAVAVVLAMPAAAQVHGGGHGGGGGVHGGGVHGGGMPRGTVHGGGARGGGTGGYHGPARQAEFHGRAFSSLAPGERAHWASGQWRHVLHNGVFGWWWFLDDDWFFYPDAIYPYPTYIAPMLSVQETPAPQPAQPYWYYCANPAGYYPYVQACPIGWQTVPAVPADAPDNAQPPPPSPPPGAP